MKKNLPNQLIWYNDYYKQWESMTESIWGVRNLYLETRIFKVDQFVDIRMICSLVDFIKENDVYMDLSDVNFLDLYHLLNEKMMVSFEEYRKATTFHIIKNRMSPTLFLRKMSKMLRNYLILCYELPEFREFNQFNINIEYM